MKLAGFLGRPKRKRNEESRKKRSRRKKCRGETTKEATKYKRVFEATIAVRTLAGRTLVSSLQVRPERATGVPAIVPCTHLHKRMYVCAHSLHTLQVAAFKMRRDFVTKKMLLPGGLHSPLPRPLHPRLHRKKYFLLPPPPPPTLAGLGFVPSSGPLARPNFNFN